jgi:hypothetical protein
MHGNGGMTYRSRPLLDLACGQSCVNCGADDGTIVAAHLAWPGVADRGIGHKCDDFWCAWLCRRCHESADSGEFHRDFFWRTQMVARTLRRLFVLGHLQVSSKRKVA